MTSELQLLCLILDGPGDIGDHIIGLRIASYWNLGDLQTALERRYPPYKGVSSMGIKMWALTTYLDEPVLLELDPETATTYNDLPLVKMETREVTSSYFPQPFSPGDAGKIHLIAKFHVYITSTSNSNSVGLHRSLADHHIDERRKPGNDVPSRLLEYYRQFWGVPLDPAITTLPDSACDSEPSGEDLNGDVLPGEPFLSVGKTRFLVRADYIRVFDTIKDIHEEAHNTHLVVLTGQQGIGKKMWILYALCRCLGEKQNVAWYEYGNCFLFSDSGVDIINPKFYQSGGKHTWCFVGSNEADDILPDSIYDSHRSKELFPIYVTPPEKARWHHCEHFRGRIPNMIVMNPWTWQEIEKGSQLYPNLDLANVHTRFRDAGPSASICLKFSFIEIQRFYQERERYINLAAHPIGFASFTTGAERLLKMEAFNTVCKMYRVVLNDVRGPYIVDPVTPSVRRRLLTQMSNMEEKGKSDLIERSLSFW